MKDKAMEVDREEAADRARERAKNVDKDKARDRAENVDREAVKEKAKGKGGKFRDSFSGKGKNLGKNKLLKMTSDHLPTGIHLPTGQKGVPKRCVDTPLGESPGMSRIRKEAKDKFYVCAFVNFQAGVGGDKETPPYTAETVDMRFELFKKCVDMVNRQNRRFKAGLETSMAGINFFCDMTKEERRPFSNGIVMNMDQ